MNKNKIIIEEKGRDWIVERIKEGRERYNPMVHTISEAKYVACYIVGRYLEEKIMENEKRRGAEKLRGLLDGKKEVGGLFKIESGHYAKKCRCKDE